MKKDIKNIIKEVLEIVNDCPKELQSICFEKLLTHYLSIKEKIQPEVRLEAKLEPEPQEKGGKDIVLTDLHTKAKHFLKQNGVLIESINQIFYKEDGEFKPLYDELGTTKITESQIRLSLLAALKNGMESGNFEFNIESIREECRSRKCYDGPNFNATFKNKKELFDNFDKIKKGEPVRLSGDGKKYLAEIIRELSA